MSVFGSATSWADTYKACGAPHQSPVNLSRSFALPCDRLCELVIDKVAVPRATAVIEEESGLKLQFTDVKPTVKFNGEGYTCKEAHLFHPAQHTVEDVRAEAEFVALFENPKGYTLAMSVPVRTAPGETPSTSFFNSFVPYPSIPEEPTQVALGDSWMLQDIVPEAKGFYVYEGTWVLPPCTAQVTWIVFANAVTIDPSDFAKLSSRSTAGSRPLQPVGDREVFFNDGEKIDSAFTKKDGKLYMRCRRIPRQGEQDAVKTSDIGQRAAAAESQRQSIAMSNTLTSLPSALSIGYKIVLLALLGYLVQTFFFSEKAVDIVDSLYDFVMLIPRTFHNTFLFWIPLTR